MTRPSLYKVVATDRWEAFFVDGLTVCGTPCAVAQTSTALHTALLQLARSDFIWHKLTPTIWILEARALAQFHTAERTTVDEERPPPDTNSDDDDGVDEEVFDLFD
eukprot:CAMPEP_0202736844 /NCGR_PEP_ID=MMETSP1388-20130828/1256_1 /ASSEMBLY_ACC=CAM_ASM_000864 /TAXON_ID=37098 /ORGANISM="Isochrysis sp, Strain CCMP1244" /LENGTH=105 /DNA_ID=CAMNT_0049403377 /DNA_START=51 /DNA_END=368 /DNA_ORIENTATION=+